MKRLCLLRHGRTEGEGNAVFKGRDDYSLSPAGIAGSLRLRGDIAAFGPAFIVTSPLKRAVQTAEAAAGGKTPIHIDSRINNVDTGLWTGRDAADIEKESPEAWDIWLKSPESMAFPGGESMESLYRRAADFIRSLEEEEADNILVVSHRAVIKAILALCLGMGTDYFRRFRIDHEALTMLEHRGGRGYMLTALNKVWPQTD